VGATHVVTPYHDTQFSFSDSLRHSLSPGGAPATVTCSYIVCSCQPVGWQDGFLAGAIWCTTRRRRCQAPALRRARHPERGGGTGAAGIPPWGTHGPGGVRTPKFFSHGWQVARVSSYVRRNADVPFPPRRTGEYRKGMISAGLWILVPQFEKR
jgi:hypothetical protein